MAEVLLSLGLGIAGTFIPLYFGFFLTGFFSGNRPDVGQVGPIPEWV